MLSLQDRINAIECFSAAFKDQNLQLPTETGFPENYQIDRWILLDIHRLLQDYKKELTKDASIQ
jgi:hypothetical protein